VVWDYQTMTWRIVDINLKGLISSHDDHHMMMMIHGLFLRMLMLATARILPDGQKGADQHH
jgi:hypothetical protein